MPFGGEPDTIVGHDYDSNGSVDLAVTRRQSSGVSLYRNDAAGSSGGIGTNYCAANANSTGQPAAMAASGSAVAAANDVTLAASRMPANAFGYFIVSQTAGFAANPGGSAGNLCLGGTIGRYDQSVQSSGATGAFGLAIDLTSIPMPTGTVSAAAGETWRFQAWFRDAQGGSATSNFTDGLAITLQ
jgi:hypothetical protein